MRKELIFSVIPAAIALAPGLAQAATITDWNKDNVVVGATPADGETGVSVIYDGDPSAPGAVSNGQVAFTPPEAISPGIKVEVEEYTQGGPDPLTLDGCLMTSNPDATCTSEFQSGKRIKTQVTGIGPIDMVFDTEASDEESNYQVFYRLINQTTQALAGFALELGFGVGNDFVQATAEDGIMFSTDFRAQPAAAGSSSTTQFPFGLFGDAASNPNFTLDGFFAPERTGLELAQFDTLITSGDFFGPYDDLFGNWVSQESVPEGAFWDHDDDDTTEALLMAWLVDGEWEMRRDVLGGVAVSLTGDDVAYFSTFDDLVAELGLGDLLFQDVIEDLANLNVNYAINLGAGYDASSFTLRTVVMPAPVAPIPLPLSAPLLAGGLGLLGLMGRRRRTA